MRTNVSSVLLFFSVILFTGFSSRNNIGTLHPKCLRCENLIDPFGIDVVTPRLSWYSVSQQRDQKQTAYQVLVASSIEKLNADEGDLWDSKKISSDRSINIIYNGKQLTSGMQCFWKAKIWDGNASEWSKAAKWSMGLLNKNDWKGIWIGLDKAVGSDKLETESTVLSAHMLRKEFGIKKKIKRATAYICGLGLFEIYFNGHKIGNQVLAPALSEYLKRSFYMTFDVTKDLKVGENAVGVILGNGRFFAMRHTVPTKTGLNFILRFCVIKK